MACQTRGNPIGKYSLMFVTNLYHRGLNLLNVHSSDGLILEKSLCDCGLAKRIHDSSRAISPSGLFVRVQSKVRFWHKQIATKSSTLNAKLCECKVCIPPNR